VKTLYLGELMNQGANARLAVEDLNRALLVDSDIRRAFFSLQALVGAAAMASKLLWPGPAGRNPDPWRPLTEERAAWLRGVVAVGDDSPLRSRSVRNGLEHFDERIDEWVHGQLESAGNFIYVDQYIGPPGGIVVGDRPAEPLRHIDDSVRGLQVSTAGKKIMLQPLFDETQRVARLAGKEEARLRRS
jgi:hypothetical protein